MLQNGRALRRYRKRWKVERPFCLAAKLPSVVGVSGPFDMHLSRLFPPCLRTYLFEILMKPALTLAVKRRRLGGCFYGFVSLLYTKHGNELH
jgi:hypothetical protein